MNQEAQSTFPFVLASLQEPLLAHRRKLDNTLAYKHQHTNCTKSLPSYFG